MANFSLLVVELLFLAATHVCGGTPWTVIGVVAILAHLPARLRLESLGVVTASLLWLVAFQASGNRELFFPYTMHLAACAALAAARRGGLAGWLGGGAVVAAFLVIRVLQQATGRVLAVEFLVAAAILAAVLAARRWSRDRVDREAAVVAAAGAVAMLGLAL